MRNKIQSFLLLSAILIYFTACDRPECTNENPVFEQNSPHSKTYKDELVKQLKKVDKTKLRYWLKKYEEKNEKEYLNFYIQGESLCAIIVLEMHDWTNLEKLHQKKGVSYRGAEFKDLTYKIQQDVMSTDFVYQSYSRIID